MLDTILMLKDQWVQQLVLMQPEVVAEPVVLAQLVLVGLADMAEQVNQAV
jgi:hypothetical protein